MKWLAMSALVVFACGPNHSQFGDAGADGSNSTGDGGCPFCGTDGASGGDGAAPCIPDPGNYDIPGNGCDDDGDGIVDNPPACDNVSAGSANNLASAIDLCTGTKP